jgi:hypothetical protein
VDGEATAENNSCSMMEHWIEECPKCKAKPSKKRVPGLRSPNFHQSQALHKNQSYYSLLSVNHKFLLVIGEVLIFLSHLVEWSLLFQGPEQLGVGSREGYGCSEVL